MEQVKKVFCYQKLFWPFTVWIDCSSDLKIFANSLTVGQNNFGNKIPFSILKKSKNCGDIRSKFRCEKKHDPIVIRTKTDLLCIFCFFVVYTLRFFLIHGYKGLRHHSEKSTAFSNKFTIFGLCISSPFSTK